MKENSKCWVLLFMQCELFSHSLLWASKTDMFARLNPSSKPIYFRNKPWSKDERKVRRYELPHSETIIRYCAFLCSTILTIIPCYCPLGYPQLPWELKRAWIITLDSKAFLKVTLLGEPNPTLIPMNLIMELCEYAYKTWPYIPSSQFRIKVWKGRYKLIIKHGISISPISKNWH